jgi:exopolysaccharide biosynthesis polyprenyl glycosylphosphotransferase
VDINIVPDLPSFQFLRHRVGQLGSLPVVNVTHSRQSGWNAASKRIFDLAFSLTALVAVSWLMAIIAILVKLTSRGPVFYRQRRASLGGREFHIIKFRSMFVGSDGADNGWSTARHDPRVTPMGRVLRKLNLDELPQLFNVAMGDMSIVGPRPELPEFTQRFNKQVKRYTLRHHVKSGMTGWAQVNGFRGRTSLRKRIQYDLDYINRWSLGFDVWIIILTLFRGFINPED